MDIWIISNVFGYKHFVLRFLYEHKFGKYLGDYWVYG